MSKCKTLFTIMSEKSSPWEGTKLKNNEILVDTSGYVPLNIRLKKIDIASAQRKLALAAFDYHEAQELFEDDEIFSQYDSLEELQSKMKSYEEKKKAIIAQKYAEMLKRSGKNEANVEQKSQVVEPKQTNSEISTTEKA